VRAYGPNKQLYVFVKGAPEGVLERSTTLWDHGKTRPLTKKDHAILTDQNQTWAEAAMRNLAFAYKELPPDTDIKKLKMDELEQDLTFLGMVSMLDPLRDEVRIAMRDAHAAHIHVSIITGDFAPTAKAIAFKAGLAENGKEITVVTGDELRQLDNTRILQLVTNGSVIFSRVSPEDKLRIVGVTKDSGHIIAVTGDGINDAPALKRADIGVAMGRTGTDVAKQSAEIVLLDDSFKTLVGAIQQGRVIFQNIKKGTLSCFTSNAAELVVSLLGLAAFILFDIPLAITVMQILAVDMIAELFPIAALGSDKADRDLMKEEPRNPHDHILNRKSVLDLLWCGLLIGSLAFANFVFFFWRNGVSAGGADASSPELYVQATTLTYLTVVLCQLFNILQRRSERGLFTRYQFHNAKLGIALIFSVFCVLNIMYNPAIAPYFGSGPLSAIDWLFALGATTIFIGAREIQRYSNKHHSREKIIELYHQNFVKQ
jgi:Ca2+-transporting ATPase